MRNIGQEQEERKGNFSIAFAQLSFFLYLACGMFFVQFSLFILPKPHSKAAQIVVLQVNKKEQKYIHLLNGRKGERGIIVGVYRKEHEICATLCAIFIHRLLGVFFSLSLLFLSTARLLWTLLTATPYRYFPISQFFPISWRVQTISHFCRYFSLFLFSVDFHLVFSSTMR